MQTAGPTEWGPPLWTGHVTNLNLSWPVLRGNACQTTPTHPSHSSALGGSPHPRSRTQQPARESPTYLHTASLSPDKTSCPRSIGNNATPLMRPEPEPHLPRPNPRTVFLLTDDITFVPKSYYFCHWALLFQLFL